VSEDLDLSSHTSVLSCGCTHLCLFGDISGKARKHTREAKRPTPLVTSRGDGGGGRPSTQPVDPSRM
jgi:hypothetical protein